MELPRGIFWIRAASGISEMHIVSLMRMSDSLYREILILTDIPVSFEGNSGKVTVNMEPSGEYDYSFLSDARSEMLDVNNRFSSFVTSLGWKCWMFPRPNAPREWDAARLEATEAMNSYSFDAVCEPNVAVNAGPNRDVIFSRGGVMSSVMCPNTGDGFWREIFRASGKFGVKAGIRMGEM